MECIRFMCVLCLGVILLGNAGCTKSEKEAQALPGNTPLVDKPEASASPLAEAQSVLVKWENQDWLTEYGWSVEMNDEHYIDWHGYKIPNGKFCKFDIPLGSTIYKQRIRNEFFQCFYQTESEKIYYFDRYKDTDGKAMEYTAHPSKDYSRISFTTPSSIIQQGPFGRRQGQEYDPSHPLVGVWSDDPSLRSEIRLVEPANYAYYFTIDKEIPGFAVRHGTYLFKQVGDKVFETDSSFPDGHMRLEIMNDQLLVLTPAIHPA